MTGSARLTLGPILFNWPAEEKRDFYFRIADEAPVDVVYLGEVVCSKRAAFFEPHLPDVAARLARAGKEVVYSSLALVMSERELDTARRLAETPRLLVEANDVSCLDLLAGRDHVVGPFVNTYNEGTLGFLAGRGARRVVLPCELSGPALGALAAAATGSELEVQVFGRLPLALSARCYHARAQGLHKDGCQYVCDKDRDGLTVETLDGEPFLAVNGTQTLSHRICNLIRELGPLGDMGIGYFRMWPHAVDMVAVARLFRAVLDAPGEAAAAVAQLAGLVGVAPFSDGFYHGREGAHWGLSSPL